MVLLALYFGTFVSIIVGLLLVNGDDGVSSCVSLFLYPAHIASGTCQLSICFCRNPENDTSPHLPNSSLSCANFALFSREFESDEQFCWFSVVANWTSFK